MEDTEARDQINNDITNPFKVTHMLNKVDGLPPPHSVQFNTRICNKINSHWERKSVDQQKSKISCIRDMNIVCKEKTM